MKKQILLSLALIASLNLQANIEQKTTEQKNTAAPIRNDEKLANPIMHNQLIKHYGIHALTGTFAHSAASSLAIAALISAEKNILASSTTHLLKNRLHHLQ